LKKGCPYSTLFYTDVGLLATLDQSDQQWTNQSKFIPNSEQNPEKLVPLGSTPPLFKHFSKI
jgi:hypothetical protein